MWLINDSPVSVAESQPAPQHGPGADMAAQDVCHDQMKYVLYYNQDHLKIDQQMFGILLWTWLFLSDCIMSLSVPAIHYFFCPWSTIFYYEYQLAGRHNWYFFDTISFHFFLS